MKLKCDNLVHTCQLSRRNATDENLYEEAVIKIYVDNTLNFISSARSSRLNPMG